MNYKKGSEKRELSVKQKYTETSNFAKKYIRGLFTIPDLIQIGLLLASIITVIIFFYNSSVQIDTTKQSIQISDKSFELSKQIALNQEKYAKMEMRAYIVLDSIKVTPFAANKNIVIHYYIANVGKTPAYSVRYKLGTKVGGNGVFQNDFDKIKENTFSESFQQTIGATRNLHVFAPTDMVLNNEKYLLIRSGKARFFIYGIFSYTDIFKEKHMIKFSVEYDASIHGFIFYPNYNNEY